MPPIESLQLVDMVQLDEMLQGKVLGFIAEPKASMVCSKWKEYAYDSLRFCQTVKFHRILTENGKVNFSYNAVRPLGEDFEESVGYEFNFFSGGRYTMQWQRTFDAWTSQSEQHYGRWHILIGEVYCETLEPVREVSEKEVRFAPPGYQFRVPVEDILKAEGKYYTAPLGSPVEVWELPVRTGQHADGLSPVHHAGMWEHIEEVENSNGNALNFGELSADARFVEIDGEMHEVSGDIVASWPEEDWPRLMKCRLRWGIQ